MMEIYTRTHTHSNKHIRIHSVHAYIRVLYHESECELSYCCGSFGCIGVSTMQEVTAGDIWINKIHAIINVRPCTGGVKRATIA